MIKEILETFELLPDWEDKYKYLIELSEKLEPLSSEYKTTKYKISGCASQVWLLAKWHNKKIKLKADSDAIIVKGLLYLAIAFYNNKTAEEIKQSSFINFLKKIKLDSHITVQRANGLKSVDNNIREIAHAFSEKNTH